MTALAVLSALAENSYDLLRNEAVSTYIPTEALPVIDTDTGFVAQAHFSELGITVTVTETMESLLPMPISSYHTTCYF